MDKQKLGRALGYGTRHAAKTLAAVAEAATAPDPRRATTPLGIPTRPAPPTARPEVARGTRTRSTTRSHRGIWAPLATFSSALWLRVTGLFFGLIAMSLGTAAWHLRGTLTAPRNPEQQHHFWIFLLFALLFLYFAASSFVRATLRERRDLRH